MGLLDRTLHFRKFEATCSQTKIFGNRNKRFGALFELYASQTKILDRRTSRLESISKHFSTSSSPNPVLTPFSTLIIILASSPDRAHTYYVCDPFVIITPRFYNILASSPDRTHTQCHTHMRCFHNGLARVSVRHAADAPAARSRRSLTAAAPPTLLRDSAAAVAVQCANGWLGVCALPLPLPNEDFGRMNKRRNPDCRSTCIHRHASEYVYREALFKGVSQGNMQLRNVRCVI